MHLNRFGKADDLTCQTRDSGAQDQMLSIDHLRAPPIYVCFPDAADDPVCLVREQSIEQGLLAANEQRCFFMLFRTVIGRIVNTRAVF